MKTASKVPVASTLLKPFSSDDRGATAIEYGLLVGISVLIIAAVTSLGETLVNDYYTPIANML